MLFSKEKLLQALIHKLNILQRVVLSQVGVSKMVNLVTSPSMVTKFNGRFRIINGRLAPKT